MYVPAIDDVTLSDTDKQGILRTRTPVEDLLDVGEGGEEGGAEAVDEDDVAVVGVGLEVGDTVQRHADEFVACVEVEGVVGGAEAAHVGVLHLGKIERFGYR